MLEGGIKNMKFGKWIQKLKQVMEGCLDNEIPIYGKVEITEKDGYDWIKIELIKETPLSSLLRLQKELDLDEDGLWVYPDGHIEIIP